MSSTSALLSESFTLAKLERGVIGHALHIALLTRKLRNLIVERHAPLVELSGGRTSGVDVLLGLHVRTGHFLKLRTRVLELLDHATSLMLGARICPRMSDRRDTMLWPFSSSRRMSELMRPTTSCI